MNRSPDSQLHPARERDTVAISYKPNLRQLLQTLRLDVSYERGAGDHLYYRDDHGHEVEVLDLVGGYGSLLLGHSHPVLVAEAQRLLTSGRPIHSQGSRSDLANQLAAELSRRAGGDYCAVFGNSGAEAIEAAMKHAMLESGARTFIALEGAFHGKTLGALQLIGHEAYRDSFDLTGVEVIRVAIDDLDGLEAAFAKAPALAGFIFEPILGEGGVRPVGAAFAQRAAALCAARGVAFIADECQTGLGRTGVFLAGQELGVQPDYIALSKSLGGGIAKISALLIRRERYCPAFDLKHSSTFAADDFSCAIALKTLSLIDDAMLTTCREKGDQLLAGLRRLAAKFPTVVADVRGRGLMLAIEFQRKPRSSSFLLRFLSSQEDLVYTLTGHLLNEHRIRVAPTLSDRFSLRLEPSALLTEVEINRFLAAIEKVCTLLAADDALGLTRFLTQGRPPDPAIGDYAREDSQFATLDEARFRRMRSGAPPTTVGWLCHLIDSDDLVSLEPPFGEWTPAIREALLARVAARVAPVEVGATDIRSATGRIARVYPILLPVTSRWLKERMDQRRFDLPRALVQQGIDLAQSLGCQTVALGQYTSIVTGNGTRVAPGEMGITTGNTYAVVLALQALDRALQDAGQAPADSTLVVAGAAGNIGRAVAELLSPHYAKTILLGSDRPASTPRLKTLAGRLPNCIATTDPRAIEAGDVVVMALNAVDHPFAAEVFKERAIVCDLSVPASVGLNVPRLRPDVQFIQGGVVALPCGEDLKIVGFPLPAGQTFGCMAEAMLLGWEGIHDRTFTGALSADRVARMARIAARHGFTLADFKRKSVMGGARGEEAYAVVR